MCSWNGPGVVLVASTWFSVQSSLGKTMMSAWLGLAARKSWKLRVPSAPSAVRVRVVSSPVMAPDWINVSSLWVTSACAAAPAGGAGAGDDGVDLRVAVLVEQRVARGVEPHRRTQRRHQRGQLAVGVRAPLRAEDHLVVRVDLAVIEREEDVGAVEQVLVGERGDELAEAGVVVLDDLRDLRSVGAILGGRIVVERDEVPDEHERGHRVVADGVGGVAQRELGLRLTTRRAGRRSCSRRPRSAGSRASW